MIKKAKKQRLIIAGLCALSLVLATVFAILTFSFINAMNYVPMWFFLGISVLCCYATLFLAFMALDRNTALKLCRIAEDCGVDNTDELAERLGWKKKATERFVQKCKKWGIIEKD